MPRLGSISILVLVGAALGMGLLYAGLNYLGRLDDGNQSVAVTMATKPLYEGDLEGSQPDAVTKHPADSANVDTVCVGAPGAITSRRDSSERTDPSVFDSWQPQAVPPDVDISAHVDASLGVSALWLPLVGGDPAVQVTKDYTRIQTYNMRGEGRVLRYQHPEPDVKIRPFAGPDATPRSITGRAGVSVEFNVAMGTFDVRTGAEASPLHPQPSGFLGLVWYPATIGI